MRLGEKNTTPLEQLKEGDLFSASKENKLIDRLNQTNSGVMPPVQVSFPIVGGEKKTFTSGLYGVFTGKESLFSDVAPASIIAEIDIETLTPAFARQIVGPFKNPGDISGGNNGWFYHVDTQGFVYEYSSEFMTVNRFWQTGFTAVPIPRLGDYFPSAVAYDSGNELLYIGAIEATGTHLRSIFVYDVNVSNRTEKRSDRWSMPQRGDPVHVVDIGEGEPAVISGLALNADGTILFIIYDNSVSKTGSRVDYEIDTFQRSGKIFTVDSSTFIKTSTVVLRQTSSTPRGGAVIGNSFYFGSSMPNKGKGSESWIIEWNATTLEFIRQQRIPFMSVRAVG